MLVSVLQRNRTRKRCLCTIQRGHGEDWGAIWSRLEAGRSCLRNPRSSGVRFPTLLKQALLCSLCVLRHEAHPHCLLCLHSNSVNMTLTQKHLPVSPRGRSDQLSGCSGLDRLVHTVTRATPFALLAESPGCLSRLCEKQLQPQRPLGQQPPRLCQALL